MRNTELVFMDDGFDCPRCGSPRSSLDFVCTTCGSTDVLNNRSIRPTAYSLSSIFLLMSLVGVCVGLTMIVPEVGIFVTLFAVFGLGRTVALVNERKRFDYPTEFQLKVAFFLKGLAVTFAAGLSAIGCAFGLGVMTTGIAFSGSLALVVLAYLIALGAGVGTVWWIRRITPADRSVLLYGFLSAIPVVWPPLILFDFFLYRPNPFALMTPLFLLIGCAVTGVLVIWLRNGRLSVLLLTGLALSVLCGALLGELRGHEEPRCAVIVAGAIAYAGALAGIQVFRVLSPWSDAFPV